MSCEIHVVASLQNIPGIRRCLFPTDDKRGGENWLQICQISVSPTGELIALANERRLVVLSSKWYTTNTYSIIYSDTIHEYDKVKSVLCLPIVGESQSSRVGPDWTCILIGYDSGYVRFYTENCELLLEEQLHCENITSVKCQSQHGPRPDISAKIRKEEIYVQYQSIICVLDGVEVFGVLRNLRSRLAKVQAKADISKIDSTNRQPPRLHTKKWGFKDQASINDAVVVGLNSSSMFDHFLTASTYGGFETRYRTEPLLSTIVMAVGSEPFLGYHYVVYGPTLPVLSDVAKVVANKLKSALPDWITGGKTPTDNRVSLAMQPVELMGCRFGLSDIQRTATSITLCQNRQFAAVADTLGRILLVDCHKGTVFRILKGYRDAQCSFVQVPDDRRSKHRLGNPVVHFLVVYSAKKGTIEIFTMQELNRIATFSASKYSRLVHISYGLLGFAKPSNSKYICPITTIFLDNDGQIKEFLIPFHFGLSEKNNKRGKDIHLYKKLRQYIKFEGCDSDGFVNECSKIISELQTVEVKLQMTELLFSKDIPPESLLKFITYFLESIEEDSVTIEDSDLKKFRNRCSNAKSLLELYIFVTSDNSDSKNVTEGFDLNLDAEELKHLLKLLHLTQVNNKNHLKEVHVSFLKEASVSASSFLSSFDLNSELQLKPELDEQSIYNTAEIIFKPYINGVVTDFELFDTKLEDSRIVFKDLLILLINFWMNRSMDIEQSLEKEMQNLYLLMTIIVRRDTHDISKTESDMASKFWEEIRGVLAGSTRSFPALMAAILCKNLILHRENRRNSTSSAEEEMLEMLSNEHVEWSLLIGKLEDVSILNIILSAHTTSPNVVLPKLHTEKANISLKHILDNGKGSVSELVARWLASSGIDPFNILVNEFLQRKPTLETKKKAKNYPEDRQDDDDETFEMNNAKSIEQVKSDPVFQQFNLLKDQFPYSLEASTVIANISWEYALAWQKDITALEYLDASLKCLLQIKDGNISRGMHQLLWNAHLKIVLESVCKLLNKTGRLPKERLCNQDTGLSDVEIKKFIELCSYFMGTFIYIVEVKNLVGDTVLRYEPIWDANEPIKKQPLVELALQQKDVNYNLLALHQQLGFVLHMIASFEVKHKRFLYTFFDSSLVEFFFTDLRVQNVDLNLNKSHAKINEARMNLLKEIILASIHTISSDNNETFQCEEHRKWMTTCLTLARIWNLDEDALRRYQVFQLYIFGYDPLGEDCMGIVHEREALGGELIMVAGKRLQMFVNSSPDDYCQMMCLMTTAITRYMASLTIECAETSLQATTTLARHVLSLIGEDGKGNRMAMYLHDACTNIEQLLQNKPHEK